MPLAYAILILIWAAMVAAELVLVAPVALVAAIGAATAATIGHFCAAAHRTLSAPERPAVSDPGEPALGLYLFVRAGPDVRDLTRATAGWYRGRALSVLARLTASLVGGRRGFLLFPLWSALCLGVVLAAVPAAAGCAVCLLVAAVGAACRLAVWAVGVGVLGALERGRRTAGHVLLSCPHRYCYRRFTVPEYACRVCGARHRRLTPNRFGALRHVCRCGARLPTVPGGRARLTAYCPHCHRSLPARIGRVRVEPLPLVGGPATGKTTVMLSAVEAMREAAMAAGGHAELVAASPGDGDGHAGRTVGTGPEPPTATMVDVSLPPAGHRILYLFDPDGQHHTGATGVRTLRYLDHAEALLFVIDPFALPSLRHALTSEDEQLIAAATVTSPADPTETLHRLLAEPRPRAEGGRRRRIGVVVTRADVLYRTSAAPAGRSAEALRAWLEDLGLGNTVRALERAATSVRYFASGPDDAPGPLAELFGWAVGLPVAHGGEHNGDETSVTPETKR